MLVSNEQFGFSMVLFRNWVFLSLKCYLLSQSKYTVDIIEHAFLIDTIIVYISFELNVQYSPSNGILFTRSYLYWTIVSSLSTLLLLILFILVINLMLLILDWVSRFTKSKIILLMLILFYCNMYEVLSFIVFYFYQLLP